MPSGRSCLGLRVAFRCHWVLGHRAGPTGQSSHASPQQVAAQLGQSRGPPSLHIPAHPCTSLHIPARPSASVDRHASRGRGHPNSLQADRARRHGQRTPHASPQPDKPSRPGITWPPPTGDEQARRTPCAIQRNRSRVHPANNHRRLTEGFAPLIRPSVTTWPDSQSLADACRQPDFSVKTCASTLDKRLSNPRFPLRSTGPEQAAEPCAQKWSTERNLVVFQ